MSHAWAPGLKQALRLITLHFWNFYRTCVWGIDSNKQAFRHLCPLDHVKLKSESKVQLWPVEQSNAAGCKLTPTAGIHQQLRGHMFVGYMLTFSNTEICYSNNLLMQLTCNSHSNSLQVANTTEPTSPPTTSLYPAVLWGRGIGFTAKIRRLPQMTAKRSVSYKRKQDFRLFA